MRNGIPNINAEIASSVTQLAQLVKGIHKIRVKIGVAESCTGGLLAAFMTESAGASEWFSCGFVTYSNDAKIRTLSVKAETLKEFGAVSEETAREMCSGVLMHSEANVAASITGVAGPTGGTPEKPVGTVCFGWQVENYHPRSKTLRFTGNRQEIRAKATLESLKGIIAALVGAEHNSPAE